MDIDTLGKATYAAYGDSVEWRNYQGLPMPTWRELTPAIRQAWRAAADFAYMLGMGGLKVEYPDPADEDQAQPVRNT